MARSGLHGEFHDNRGRRENREEMGRGVTDTYLVGGSFSLGDRLY